MKLKYITWKYYFIHVQQQTGWNISGNVVGFIGGAFKDTKLFMNNIDFMPSITFPYFITEYNYCIQTLLLLHNCHNFLPSLKVNLTYKYLAMVMHGHVTLCRSIIAYIIASYIITFCISWSTQVCTCDLVDILFCTCMYVYPYVRLAFAISNMCKCRDLRDARTCVVTWK